MYRQLCLQSELSKQLQTKSKEIGYKQPTAKARMKPSAKMMPKPPDHPPGGDANQPMQVDEGGGDEQQPMQVDGGGDDMLTTHEQAKNILAFNDKDVYDELYNHMKDDSDVG